MKYTHWMVSLTAGAIFGAALWTNKPNYIAMSLPMVLASWFYPKLEQSAENAGKKTAQWLDSKPLGNDNDQKLQ